MWGSHGPAPRGLVSGSAVIGLLGLSMITADGKTGGGRPIPAQLPHDVSGFTGREPELAALESLASGQESAPVVILAIDGVAGIGKTALAVHFAHRVAAGFPDGQLFVNLHGFDPDQPPLAPGAALAGFVRALGADPPRAPTDLVPRNWKRFGSCHPDHLATGAAALTAIYPGAGNPFAPLTYLPEEEGLEPWPAGPGGG